MGSVFCLKGMDNDGVVRYIGNMKTSYQVIRTLTATLDLPLGHYAKKEAEERVSEIYSKARENEKIIRRKMKKERIPLYFEKPEYFDICQYVCKTLFVTGIKKLVFRSPDVDQSASAHYFRGEIHVKDCNACLTTIIHELTHHIERCEHARGDHGDAFVEFENLVFESFLSWYYSNSLDKIQKFW